MLHGRLYCPQTDGAYLGACVLQSELGDYDKKEHREGYVSEYKLFLKQTSKLEDRVAEVHKTLRFVYKQLITNVECNFRGQNPAVAEMNFLKRASMLDTYGFDPYTVKVIFIHVHTHNHHTYCRSRSQAIQCTLE
jgi:hypothetical protein